MNAAIETRIVPRTRDLGGGFEVRRVLPSGERRTVGPFVFFDQMGPTTLLAGTGLDVRPHPRIGLATVSEVVMESGGKLARVYVEVQGTEEEAEETMEGLEKAKGYIRHAVKISLGLRRVPELLFYNDRSSKDEARIDQLLGRMKKRKK